MAKGVIQQVENNVSKQRIAKYLQRIPGKIQPYLLRCQACPGRGKNIRDRDPCRRFIAKMFIDLGKPEGSSDSSDDPFFFFDHPGKFRVAGLFLIRTGSP